MADAFPVCKINHAIAEDVLNFITCCLNIVPEKRPSVQKLQEHKLFGGTWQYTYSQVDIWKNKGEAIFFSVFDIALQLT